MGRITVEKSYPQPLYLLLGLPISSSQAPSLVMAMLRASFSHISGGTRPKTTGLWMMSLSPVSLVSRPEGDTTNAITSRTSRMSA